MSYEWVPENILFVKPTQCKYAVVILNRDIQLPCDVMLNIWNCAHLRVTVDGGTDRWLSWLKKHSFDTNSVKLPSLITGDMDSISKETMTYFKSKPNVTIIRTPDQNNTDYTKALMEISKLNLNLDYVFVLADTSGRLDHIFAYMNTLYRSVNILPDVEVYQLAYNSMTWLLKPGNHCIRIPKALQNQNEWCGLIPLGKPCMSVSTTGLKWNLSNSRMEFGHIVSTSNTYNGEDCVTVTSDSPLVWTMGIKSLLL